MIEGSDLGKGTRFLRSRQTRRVSCYSVPILQSYRSPRP